MKKKGTLVSIGLLLISFCFSTAGLAAEKVTICFATPLILPTVRETILEAQQNFMKKNPYIDVKIDDMGSAVGMEFSRARIATGDFPDLVRIKITDLKELIAYKAIQPLPAELAAMTEPSLSPVVEGKQWFVCYVKGFCGLAYNVDAFSKVGFKEPPMTLKDFVTLCKKLKAAGYEPVAIGMKNAWQANLPLLWMTGNEMFTKNPNWGADLRCGKAKFTSPEFINLLKHVNEDVFAYLPISSLGNNLDQAKQLFFNGKAAMLTSGVWLNGDVETVKPAFKAALMPLPAFDAKNTHFDSYADQGFVLSAETKGAKLAAAIKWLKYFYSKPVYQKILDAEGQFGAVRGATAWAPHVKGELAQAFVDDANKLLDKVGTIPAYDHQMSMANLPVAGWLDTLAKILQQMAAGDNDYTKHAKMLQAAFDKGLKAERY